MKGTVEELIWFIIYEHKKFGIKCEKSRISYLLLLIECYLINSLKKESIFKDIEYIGFTFFPVKCEVLEEFLSSCDLTEWIDETKEKMVLNFIKTNEENLIDDMKYVIYIFKEHSLIGLSNIIFDSNCPIAKYHRSLDDKKNVPKQELAEWFKETFLDTEEETDENTYTKDGQKLD